MTSMSTAGGPFFSMNSCWASSNLQGRAATSGLVSDRYGRGTRLREGRRIAWSQPRGCYLQSSESTCSSFFSSFCLRLFHAGENLVQPVVVLLQRFPQHCEPLVHCFDAGLCETTRALRAIHAKCNKSCVFEHFQVLRDCRLRHLEGLG